MQRACVLLCCAAALAIAAPAGAAPVARVLRVPIKRHVFQHWMLVAARSRGDHAVIPAYPSARWKELRDETMQFLISARWIEGEARLQGVGVSRAEALRRFRRTRHESFPTRAKWQMFLRHSAMTVADIVYRVRLDMLSNRIRAAVLRGVHGSKAQQNALDAFVTRFRARWRARTVCARRYATADCGHIVGR